MKNLAIIFFTMFMCVTITAQTPQSFRYQAVARDGAGNVLADKAVSFRISILQTNVNGTVKYSETHSKTTNSFGLVDMEIGKGTLVSGSFAGISWGSDIYFVKIEMDPEAGSSFQWLGTSQLLSVPYALYARDVLNKNDADADPANELQKISISGTVLTLDKSGGSVTLPSSGGDNWGTQSVATDATLSGNGTTITPLKIADNGVNSSKIADGSIASADIANSAITSDKINAGAVNGAKIAQAGATSGQSLKWNGTTWAPAADETGTGIPTGPAGGDLTGTYPNPTLGEGKVTSAKIADAAIVSADLANNAVTTDKINTGAVTGAKIAQAGATSGQALKWNGTTWAPATDATVSGGWVDDGTTLRLSTSADSVTIGSVNRLGKLNVGGNIGMSLPSSIYFGSDAIRISGLVGGDLRFVAEDLSMLTTEDITFGHLGDESWIKFDNTNKRVGIGTLTPSDKFHVLLDDASAGLSAVKGIANPTTVSNYGIYGESKSASGYGVFGKSPKYGVYGTTTGYQGRGLVGEATNTASIGVQGIATNTSSTGVWGEGSNQGVYGFSSSKAGKGIYGKVTSAAGYSGYFEGGQFYVKGSAQVKDTLYANVVNADKIINMPGLAHSVVGSPGTYPTLETSWAELNSVTVNVPAPGYVLLMASCEFESDHTYNDQTSVYLGVSKTSDGTGIKEIAHWRISYLTGSDLLHDVISAQAPLQVASAGTQTFYLMGYRVGADVVYRHQCNLTALYVPVAYGTVE